jgi:hypothetical protein
MRENISAQAVCLIVLDAIYFYMDINEEAKRRMAETGNKKILNDPLTNSG